MKVYQLQPIERHYANNGQHLEQVYRFNKTGLIEKADNRKNAPDCGTVQIKCARATICHGTDYVTEIALNPAESYAYITATLTCYEMTKTEFTEFVTEFGTATFESKKNGGSAKIRLGHETTRLLQWLASRAA